MFGARARPLSIGKACQMKTAHQSRQAGPLGSVQMWSNIFCRERSNSHRPEIDRVVRHVGDNFHGARPTSSSAKLKDVVVLKHA